VILVTVGTERPFDRLVTRIDQLCAQGYLKDVYMQIGANGRPPKHARYARLLAYQEIETAMRQADLIVAHAGPGSIALARSLGKKPLVVPRRPDLAEVVDQHQILLARRLHSLGLVHSVEDLEAIGLAILALLASGESRLAVDESNSLAVSERLDRIGRELVARVRVRTRWWSGVT
jgi:UDP-N-acetylglucosamine transferase subunit ALG13